MEFDRFRELLKDPPLTEIECICGKTYFIEYDEESCPDCGRNEAREG